MKLLTEYKEEIMARGYNSTDAEARLCQDIVLKALSNSTLSRNATIKGGVVMRSLSGDARRATQDLDIDFIRYSLSDESIDRFIRKLDSFPDFTIERTGVIRELKQEDYQGKRAFIIIRDKAGNTISSKIDFGVHKNLEIEQDEYCFDIFIDNEGASVLINSAEQIFTEKLKSLLKFGRFSTRYKDIFDLFCLSEKVDLKKLKHCFEFCIFGDPEMRENSGEDICRRIKGIFANPAFVNLLKTTDKNWLEKDVDEVIKGIEAFLESPDLTD